MISTQSSSSINNDSTANVILDSGFVIKLILNYIFLISLIKDSRLSNYILQLIK
jgi:uncharacterized protein YqhQ